MHKSIKMLVVAVLVSCLTMVNASFAQQFSGINNITFHNTKFNKAFAGNGFLLKHNDKLYAVTVKHTFLEAKTPDMETVSIAGYVNEWRIHPNNQPQNFVKLGKLLNENLNEALDMKILQKDWLVFEVVENNSSLAVLTLRNSPLKPNETLTAYGCSYANQATCQQDAYVGNYLATEPHNLRIAMPNLALNKLRGLSGSPVLDSQNKLVGIVSNVLRSHSGEGFDFAPANLTYLREVLNTLQE